MIQITIDLLIIGSCLMLIHGNCCSLKEDLFTINKTNANDSNIIVTLASLALCHFMVSFDKICYFIWRNMIRENSCRVLRHSYYCYDKVYPISRASEAAIHRLFSSSRNKLHSYLLNFGYYWSPLAPNEFMTFSFHSTYIFPTYIHNYMCCLRYFSIMTHYHHSDVTISCQKNIISRVFNVN